MKNVVIIVFCAFFNIAQSQTDSLSDKYVKLADNLRLGRTGHVNNKRAAYYYKYAADMGNEKAQNKLALMHIKNIGVDKACIDSARILFKKAAEKGNASAMYNVGLMYKYGKGVDVNYKQAFDWFKKSALSGNNKGIYATGYCYAHGLGVKQDYSKCIQWFQKGAKKQNMACEFWLGICYRNGYGVTRDESKALNYLQRASAKGYREADKELAYDAGEALFAVSATDREAIDETAERMDYLDGANLKNQPLNMNGIWKGKLIVYDYSGEYVLKEQYVEMDIIQNDNKFNGTFTKQEQSSFTIEGIIAKEAVCYTSGEWKENDRYGIPLVWTIKTGVFYEYVQHDKRVLAGKLSTYSPSSKEPGNPSFLLLKQNLIPQVDESMPDSLNVCLLNDSIDTTEDEFVANVISEEDVVSDNLLVKPTIDANEQLNVQNAKGKNDLLSESQLIEKLEGEIQLKAFPNPFRQSMELEFTMPRATKLTISMYSMAGQFVAPLYRGQCDEGVNLKTISDLNVAPGQYLIVLISEAGKKSIKVVRK